MDVKALSEQERSDFDEAWAKFACLMRGDDNCLDIGEAAVRFLRHAHGLGLERVIHGHALTLKHLEQLGPGAVAMAGIGLASKAAQILVKIIKAEQSLENPELIKAMEQMSAFAAQFSR